MSKKTKIIIGVLLVLAIAIYFLFPYIKQLFKPKQSTDSNTLNNTSSTGTLTATNSVFPLKVGSKGNEVLQLQKAINVLLPVPFSKISEDSIFGSQTQTALNTVMGAGYYPLTQLQYNVVLQKAKEKTNPSIYQF